MTNDDIRRIIDLLERKCEERMRAAGDEPTTTRGHEAHGFACGLAYAIGVLGACIRDE